MSELAFRQLDPGTLPRLESLDAKVFAFLQDPGTWGLSNAGLVQANGNAVLIDTFYTERRNELLHEMVTDIAPVPPNYLINTHYHVDHVNGNAWYPQATIIGHAETREGILRTDVSASARRFTDVDFGRSGAVPPSLVFQSDLRLDVGSELLDVCYPGLAHCRGNTVVYLRRASILFAGDLLLGGCTPTFSYGSAVGYAAVLERLREFGAERIVPGHGPVSMPSIIDETERYVRWVLAAAADGLAAGRLPLEVAARLDLGEFATWHDQERIVGNLYRAFAELSDDPDHAMDMEAMWRDTVAYLGHPMRSLA
jgi:cyclase